MSRKAAEPKHRYADLSNKIKIAIDRQNAVNVLRDSEQRLSDIINFLPGQHVCHQPVRTGNRLESCHRRDDRHRCRRDAGEGGVRYAIPFYGIRRKILIDLIFEPDEIIAKDYAHIIHEKDMLIADTVLSRPKGRTVTLMGKAGPLYNREGEIVGGDRVHPRYIGTEECRKRNSRSQRADLRGLRRNCGANMKNWQ